MTNLPAAANVESFSQMSEGDIRMPCFDPQASIFAEQPAHIVHVQVVHDILIFVLNTHLSTWVY